MKIMSSKVKCIAIGFVIGFIVAIIPHLFSVADSRRSNGGTGGELFMLVLPLIAWMAYKTYKDTKAIYRQYFPTRSKNAPTKPTQNTQSQQRLNTAKVKPPKQISVMVKQPQNRITNIPAYTKLQPTAHVLYVAENGRLIDRAELYTRRADK